MSAWVEGEDRGNAGRRGEWNGRIGGRPGPARLMTTTALATALCGLMALPIAAQAGDVEIDDKIETPILSSNADGDGPGDVTVTKDGKIEVVDGPAITLDSDNDILNEGEITVSGDDGAIGIELRGGFSGDLLNDGDLIVVSADEDDEDAPLGANKTGILVSGPDAFTGSITLGDDSFIRVEGTDSFGVRVATDFVGDIANDGQIRVNGNGSKAIAVEGDLDGSVIIESSSIIARGEDALGVVIEGDVTGGYVHRGLVTTTSPLEGFVDDPDTEEDNDLPEAKGGVWIGGSLGTGFFTAGAFDDGDDENDDAELTGNSTISAEVSRAAVLISPEVSNGANGNITLGVVDTDALDAASIDGDDYGFLNRGSIVATGLDEKQDTTAVDITGWGGFTTTVTNGVKNTGSIRAATFDAEAIALRIGTDATADEIVNDGTLSASGNGVDGAVATALEIDAGASVTTLVNTGTIRAESSITRNEDSVATDVEAYGVRDLAGSLTTIVNEGGLISASADFLPYADDDDDDFNDFEDREDGTAFALDLSASTSDITLTNSGSITGAVTFGSGNDTLSIIEHADNADLDEDQDEFIAFVSGVVDMGAGLNTFSVDGDSVFSGGLRATGGSVDLTVANGTIAIFPDEQFQIRNGTFGTDSTTAILLNQDNAGSARIEATGTVTIEDGAAFDIRLEEYLGDSADVVIIDAADLVVAGSLEITDEETLFFLYNNELAVSEDDPSQLVLSLDVKDPDELGLNSNQTSAYGAVLETITEDDELGAALGNIGNGDDFLRGYQQLLPDSGLAQRAAALAMTDQNTQAIAARLDGLRRVSHTTRSTAWFQAYGNVYNQDTTDFDPGFSGETYGVAGGFDYSLLWADAIGINFAWGGSRIEEENSRDEELIIDSYQIGAYAGWSAGPVFLALQGHGGYNKYRQIRKVEIDNFERETEGDWDGHQYGGSARVGADFVFGGTRITPMAGLDYLSLTQNGFTESGGDGIDLMVEEREATSTRASAGIEIAHRFRNGDGAMIPRLRAGVVQELESDPLTTTASFRDGNQFFDVVSNEISDTAITGGIGINYELPGVDLQLGYDALVEEEFMRHSGGITFRFTF